MNPTTNKNANQNTNKNTNNYSSFCSKGVTVRLQHTDWTKKCDFCCRPPNPHLDPTKSFSTCCVLCSKEKGNGKHTNDCNIFKDLSKDGAI